MQRWRSWHWFCFLVASTCSVVALLLWPLASELDWRAWGICLLLLAALSGMLLPEVTPRTLANRVVNFGQAQRFLQHCLQLDEWRQARHIDAAVACRRTAERALVYVHPHANCSVDLSLLRQLVLLMCRYDCDKVRIYSYAGVTAAALTISELLQLEVIDHKQIFSES